MHSVQGFTSGATYDDAERGLPEGAPGARARVQEVAFTALVNVPAWVVQKLPLTQYMSEADRGEIVQFAAQRGDEGIVGLLLASGGISDADRGQAVRDACVHAPWYEGVVRLLLASGGISGDDRADAVLRAVHSGGESIAGLLLESGYIPEDCQYALLRAAVFYGCASIIPRLLIDVDIATHLLWAAGEGNGELVEVLLASVPSISFDLRDLAIRQAAGDDQASIQNMLRQMVVFDAMQPFEQITDDVEVEWVRLTGIQAEPLILLRKIADIQRLPRFSLMESPMAVDLGGVTKQVVTVLVDALIDKKWLETDPILRLPILVEGKSPDVLQQFGQFLSILDLHNMGRRDKVLIGARWSPELFELLNLEEGASTTDIFVRILEEIQDPNYAFWIDLLKNSKNEKALAAYSEAYSCDLEEAEEDFIQWRKSVETAIAALRSGLAPMFKVKLQAILSKDFSNQIQGVEASAEMIIEAFELGIVTPDKVDRFKQRVQWLQEWILGAEETQRKTFLMAITGRNVLSEGDKIKINWSQRTAGAVELHTCFNSIDFPNAEELTREELLDAVRFAIEHTGYSID